MYKLLRKKTFYLEINKNRVTWDIMGEKGIFQELPMQPHWSSNMEEKERYYQICLWIVRKYALSPKFS